MNRKGFTLTEIAIVLGVVGTILGSIWVAAGNLHNQQKADKTVQEIITIVHNVRSFYATRQSIAPGCKNYTYVQAGLIPSDMVLSGGATVGACGGAGYSMVDGYGQSFDVGSQTGWDGIPGSPTAFEVLLGWPTNTMTAKECGMVLSQVASLTTGADGLIAIGGQRIPLTDLSTVNEDTFASCSGHFTLQFSLK